jgi:hypothetical protein
LPSRCGRSRIASRGRRPIEWLLGDADVDARWCLVHATPRRGASSPGSPPAARGGSLPHRGEPGRRHISRLAFVSADASGSAAIRTSAWMGGGTAPARVWAATRAACAQRARRQRRHLHRPGAL